MKNIKIISKSVTAAALCFALTSSLVPIKVAAGPNDLFIEGTMQCTDIVGADAVKNAFRARYPGYSVNVSVHSDSPTTTALTDIKNNAVDIAAAARGLSQKVNGYSPDDPGDILTDQLIGREVICMIVSFQTNVNQITYDQIKKIYEGNMTDWSGLGGQVLIPRARNDGSGLRKTFCSLGWFAGVTDTIEATTITATGLSRLNSDTEMINEIAAHPNQIGYVGMGSLLTAFNVKPLKISVSSTELNYIAPTLKNVYSGVYPEGRGLHLWYLTNDPDNKQAVTDFVNFMKSKAGQDAVQAAGAVRALPLQDLNGDGNVNIGDIVKIGNEWNLSGAPGWMAEDVNGDGYIDIGDVAAVGLWWNFTYAITV